MIMSEISKNGKKRIKEKEIEEVLFPFPSSVITHLELLPPAEWNIFGDKNHDEFYVNGEGAFKRFEPNSFPLSPGELYSLPPDLLFRILEKVVVTYREIEKKIYPFVEHFIRERNKGAPIEEKIGILKAILQTMSSFITTEGFVDPASPELKDIIIEKDCSLESLNNASFDLLEVLLPSLTIKQREKIPYDIIVKLSWILQTSPTNIYEAVKILTEKSLKSGTVVEDYSTPALIYIIRKEVEKIEDFILRRRKCLSEVLSFTNSYIRFLSWIPLYSNKSQPLHYDSYCIITKRLLEDLEKGKWISSSEYEQLQRANATLPKSLWISVILPKRFDEKFQEEIDKMYKKYFNLFKEEALKI